MVVWVLGILIAVAVPTIGSTRDASRVRFAAATVAQDIRLTGQLAFSHGRAYSLDASKQPDALIRTGLGLESEVVLDLLSSDFRSVLVPSTLYPLSATLELSKSGEATSAVSWTVVSGSIAADVSQAVGPVNPTVSALTKPSKALQEKYNARVISAP